MSTERVNSYKSFKLRKVFPLFVMCKNRVIEVDFAFVRTGILLYSENKMAGMGQLQPHW